MKTSLPQLTPPAFGVSKSELKALRKQAVKTNNTALLADLRRAKDTLIPQRRQLTRDIHRITGRYKKGFETGQLLYYLSMLKGLPQRHPL
jgi:predicted phage-related endonuclease